MSFRGLSVCNSAKEASKEAASCSSSSCRLEVGGAELVVYDTDVAGLEAVSVGRGVVSAVQSEDTEEEAVKEGGGGNEATLEEELRGEGTSVVVMSVTEELHVEGGWAVLLLVEGGTVCSSGWWSSSGTSSLLVPGRVREMQVL